MNEDEASSRARVPALAREAAARRALPDVEAEDEVQEIDASRCSPTRSSSATGASSCCPAGPRTSQVALADSNVLVIGAGALGSPVALYLAGAGVGRLGIADSDVVELSNLPRQPLHFTPDMGMAKVESAASKLRFLNPEIIVEPYNVRVEAENALGLIEPQDLVSTAATRSRRATPSMPPAARPACR